MPGQADRNLRSATLNEDVGVLLLSSFCAIAPVPRQHDVGVDVICTLLRPDGPRLLLAEESFYVQIKSKSIETISFLGAEYEWFQRLELPYFLACVDAEAGELELFSLAMSRMHFVEGLYKGILFTREQVNVIDIDGVRQVQLGEPVATLSLRELKDRTKLDRMYEIVKAVVRVDADNRELIKVRTMRRLHWKTNEVPTADGTMTLVNVGHETFQLEVIDALLKTLRGSLIAFASDAESFAAIAPLFAHAASKARLTKDDLLMFKIAMQMTERGTLRGEQSNETNPKTPPDEQG